MESTGSRSTARRHHRRRRGADSAAGGRSPFHSGVASASVSPIPAPREHVIQYVAAGGGNVFINGPINPWQVLGLTPNVSRGAVKMAFREKIKQSARQNRAMVSLANHMLTSTVPNRYQQKPGTNEFFIKDCDVFVLAACGHTTALSSKIASRKSLLEETDEHNRSLLYTACKSGFYDMCKLLLQRGASINKCQVDGSTPLHAAAFFGHTLLVGLLLEYGAKIDIKNKWGHTALQESTSHPDIQRLIQTAPSDIISSLAAKLTEKKLVTNMRLVEFKGKVIAKELLRDPSSLDRITRAEWDNILESWELTWHGTRYRHLESIIEKGLIPAGTDGIQPPSGHFSLGKEYFGIRNWAAAIFTSPSILYAGHAAYADRVVSQRQQWCVLVKAYCKPNTYKSYDPTVFEYTPMEGEPAFPEFRVPVAGADKNVILRVESKRSVVVRSLVFVHLSFLEDEDVKFEEVKKLFTH